MTKITLPLVMIASLATLVSCGHKNDTDTVLAPTKTPIVSGIVLTETSTGTTQSGTINTVSTGNTMTHDEMITYKSPAGDDMIGVSVVLTDGIITSLTVTPHAENDISKQLQASFAKNVNTQVIGKKAKDLKLDAVGGASLTTAAFEQYVHSL